MFSDLVETEIFSPSKAKVTALERRMRYERGLEILRQNDIEFVFVNPFKLRIGSHVDFWPSTGRFKDYSSNLTAFGITKLLKHLGESVIT